MKMSIETRARIAFAVVALVGAIAGLAWYVFASGQYTTYQIRTQDPVSGLIVDAPVEFHGVEVGKVKRVELADPHSVSILLNVKKEAPITSATVATITGRGLATRGFTGYVYVSLEDAGADARPLAAPPGNPFPVIATAPSRYVSLDTSINQLNQNVQYMTDLLQSIMDQKTVAALKQSVDSLQQVSRTLAANNEKLGTIILNAERASAQFQPLLQSSNDAVKVLQSKILPEAYATLVRLDSLSTSLDEKLGPILLNTEKASAQLEPLLQSGNEAVRSFQMQILPEAYRTLIKLDSLSTSLDEVVTMIRRDPSVLIRGSKPPTPGPGETK
jgi:phospholipid/cholesterol/gamma-HCH transport system substrate-binding protein